MYKKDIDFFLIIDSMKNMKINRDELSSSIYLATCGVITTLSTFNLLSQMGQLTPLYVRALLKDIPHFQRVVKFSETHMNVITNEMRSIVEENLDIIQEISLDANTYIDKFNEQSKQ